MTSLLTKLRLVALATLLSALAIAGTALASSNPGSGNSQASSHPPQGAPQGGPHGGPSGQPGGNAHAGTGTQAEPGPPTSGNQGVGPESLPPKGEPVEGKSVDAGVAKGSVTVVLPGSSVAIPLTGAASIPVGAVIDATDGAVTLTSVKSSGITQTGEFWGGEFRVGQTRGARPVTELTLVDPALGVCSAPPHSRRLGLHAARSRRRVSLWGRDNHGSFRTRGRGAVAVVRGTEWMTQDSCEGTLVEVRRGAVSVRDLHRRRTVVVHAGASYLARVKG